MWWREKNLGEGERERERERKVGLDWLESSNELGRKEGRKESKRKE